jgi:large subunit ribosomal protein L19
MTTKIENFLKAQMKANLPEIKVGDTVLVSQRIPSSASASAKSSTDKSANKKERNLPVDGQGKIQSFEGLVIARKHGKEIGSTITVRKVISGIGVERVFPLHSPIIEKIEVLRKGKARRAKLYYLRTAKGKRSKLKQI